MSKDLDPKSFFKVAKRKKIPLKIAISGPSGSGKTYSSLLLAKGLVGSFEKIAVIDTEDSAALYSQLGDYNVLSFNKPYDPKKFIKAIQMANQAGFEAIIIDSLSHSWSGPGGLLDIHQSFGGRFQDWSKVTPLYNELVQTIKESKAHVISCMRKKVDYSITNEGGKTKVEKLGLKEEQREGYEYEQTLAIDIDMKHLASASKDRTGLFVDKTPFLITEETGRELLAWSNQGE